MCNNVFLCGLLALAEAIIKPYISEKGVVSNCKIYKWNDIKLIKIRDSSMTFQVRNYLGRHIIVDLEEIKEQDIKTISGYLKG